MKTSLAAFAFSVIVAPALAATQSVTLSVPGMNCAACPITVKKALSRVDGVRKTEVNFEKREAIVTFDNTKTSAQKLIRVTEAAGYPASLKR